MGPSSSGGPCDLTALSQRSNLTLDDVRPVIEDLAKQGGITLLGGAKAGPGSQVYSRQGMAASQAPVHRNPQGAPRTPSPSTGHPQGGIQEPPGRIRGRLPPPPGPPGGRKVGGRRRSRRSLPRLPGNINPRLRRRRPRPISPNWTPTPSPLPPTATSARSFSPYSSTASR